MRYLRIFVLLASLQAASAAGESHIHSGIQKVAEKAASNTVSCGVITPRPFEAGGVWTTITLPDSFRVAFSVVDTLSVVIYRSSEDTLGPGVYQIHWDNEYTNGDTVPGGVYLFRLTVKAVHYYDVEFDYGQRFVTFQ